MSLKANDLAVLPDDARAEFLASLSTNEKAALLYEWKFWARENQIAPTTVTADGERIDGDWFVWLCLAGRGFGKSRSGAEWVRAKAESHPGCRIALVARTAADYRDVMVEGESGLLAVCPP